MHKVYFDLFVVIGEALRHIFMCRLVFFISSKGARGVVHTCNASTWEREAGDRSNQVILH